LKNVKDACSHYFANYEESLEEIKIRTHTLENKYSEWSKLLIEPTSINEARLFSLETRVHEEEDMRIKEYNFLRELIKKLLYSLEQRSLDGTQTAPDLRQLSLDVRKTSMDERSTLKDTKH